MLPHLKLKRPLVRSCLQVGLPSWWACVWSRALPPVCLRGSWLEMKDTHTSGQLTWTHRTWHPVQAQQSTEQNMGYHAVRDEQATTEPALAREGRLKRSIHARIIYAHHCCRSLLDLKLQWPALDHFPSSEPRWHRRTAGSGKPIVLEGLRS